MVIQTEALSPAAAAWLAGRCNLVVCPYEDPGFLQRVGAAAGLVVRTYTIVDEALLAAAPRLRVVGRAGVGLDNIDVAACRKRGIEVVYTPDANTQAVVEFVVCLLCDAMRPRITLPRAIGTDEWNRLRQAVVGERQMNQLTLGVLGLGRVGGRVAEVAGVIGYRVLYNDLLVFPPEARHGAEPVSVRALFEQSDVVSVHIDGRAGNRRFVNADLIDRMKPNAILVNTSRGLVVDSLALAAFLKSRPEALALLDVHDPEPFAADYPLLGLPNARLYPHLASRTQTAMDNMSWVVRDVAAVLEGRAPQFPAPPDQTSKRQNVETAN
jgi:phosphoglycerate dehydrogenase-like enzyme